MMNLSGAILVKTLQKLTLNLLYSQIEKVEEIEKVKYTIGSD